MSLLTPYNTSYGKKVLFYALLSDALDGCRCRVDALYEWKNSGQVLSLRMVNGHIVRFGMNLNTGSGWIFRESRYRDELAVRYRAYYMANYIRCVENVERENPQSYYYGLVQLCVINAICSRHRVRSCYPVLDERQTVLKPVDVHCAIRALTMVMVDCVELLSEHEKRRCDEVINHLLTYSLLPEIEYRRKRAVYALMSELKELQNNAAGGRMDMNRFPLLAECGIHGLKGASLDGFLDGCLQIPHPFWSGTAVRLLLYARGEKVSVAKEVSVLKDEISRFMGDGVRYAKELKKTNCVLLKDNYAAVKRLSEGMGSVFQDGASESGKLHSYH